MPDFSYVNVNGVIGRGAYSDSDFSTAEDLVAHMDYLGIARSLVWHMVARDQNPTAGNRLLLTEITEAGLADRLIPAFVITPACFFEFGVLDFLREQLGSGRVRALRLTPSESRFPVRQIERVLAELAEYQPLVLWDLFYGGSESDLRDFETLARRFPDVPFAVTQKMWGGFGSVLDLMWRCPNVHVDISWLHMRDTIELLCEEFGADRVLFGIGFKAHYGAAIGVLRHARISEAQRGHIAHGNAERLLKIDPAEPITPRPTALLDAKALWRRHRQGEALADTPIIDAHGHTAPHTRGWIIRSNTLESGMDEVIERMDRLGIDRIILSPESALFGENLCNNRAAEQALAPYKHRVSGYLVFNPRYGHEMAPNLDEFFQRDFFVGFKLLPSYWHIPLTDPGYIPVWEYAHRYRLPILMHTWDDSWNSPAMLTDVVARYPGAFFLLGHSGGGTRGRFEAEALAQANPNVFLEFCGSFTTPVPFEDSLKRVGPDQIIFGTDTAAHDPAWELARYLSLPVADEWLIPGLAANMQKILEARVTR